MATLNWLHFTDFHCGLESQSRLWPKLRADLFSDLRKLHDIAGPWHVVLFTGDLTQAGEKK